MITYDIEQGTAEWLDARIGVITASDFSKILTPKTMKLSASADMVANKIVAQIVTGTDETEFSGNYWTDRGNVCEPEAVSLYEIINDVQTSRVGFVTNNEGTIGCSPDRFVGEDGGLEIKCPAAHTHIAALLNDTIADDHRAQVQGCLMVTGRQWWDCMSYHPEFRPSIIRVERDEDFIKALSDALEQVWADIKTKLKTITPQAAE